MSESLNNEKKLILEIKDATLTYKSKKEEIRALEPINLNVYEEDFVCVLGPSGCGKSTLLKMIAGFEKPTSGELILEGEKINGIDWHRGVVFQRDNLFEWFSVKDNVNYGLRMRKFPKNEIEEKTQAILKQVGLEEFADKKVYELSGGMRQRASIARTLINTPDIILMDEPFSALDALTREQMQDFLRELWMENKNTIFFITHDINEALVLGTKVVVLSKRPGKIIFNEEFDFTYKIHQEGTGRIKYTDEYFVARRKLYELISAQ